MYREEIKPCPRIFDGKLLSGKVALNKLCQVSAVFM